MHIASIGIDIGKTTFHLVALDEHGSIVLRKKFSRKQLLDLYCQPLGLADWYRSMWRGALSGACPTEPRT